MKFTHEITSGSGDDECNYKHKCFNCGYANYYNHQYPRDVEIEISLDLKMEETDLDLIRIKEELEYRYSNEIWFLWGKEIDTWEILIELNQY